MKTRHPRLIVFGLLFFCVVFLSLFFLFPSMMKTIYYFNSYKEFFDQDLPSITITRTGLEIETDKVNCYQLAHELTAFVVPRADTLLFQDVKPMSFMLAPHYLMVKKQNGEIFDMKLKTLDIEHPTEINADKIYESLNKYGIMIIFMVTLASLILIMLAFAALGLIGAGIGMIIDGFWDGPHSFSELFITANLFLTLFLIFTVALEKFYLELKMAMELGIVAYILAIVLFVWSRVRTQE
jgi:hypothetical protein